MQLQGHALDELWDELLPALERPELHVDGSDEQLPSVFRVERLAETAIAAAHLSASAYEALRTGAPAQPVSLGMREAAAAFCSEQYLKIDGETPSGWAPLSGDYRARDGRYVRLHCNFAHHASAAARALGCEETKDAFERAVSQADALEVEDAVIEAGGAAGAARTREEWQEHPHCAALAARPLIAMHREGDAAPVLQQRSLRVLDLTRVIAGPVAGKVLAAYGADVLHVASTRLPTIAALDVDHGFGKRSCDLDLRSAEDAESFRALIRDADILVESYRPGALERLGFGFDEVKKLRPDIIYVSLSAYGDYGPWAGRRGFDSIVQMSTGIVRAQNASERPRPLPCQALDHGTGYLAAFGAMSAAIRRASEGGAWRVRLSLARTAEALWRLGLHDHLAVAKPAAEQIAPLLRSRETPSGKVTYVPVSGRIGARTFDTMPAPGLHAVAPKWR